MSIMLFNSFLSKIIPLSCSILGFGILVAVHEFGHFIFCKLFKIHTPTFSIGFGPELYSKKIGGTKFRIAAIPLGGYCEIAGLAEVGQGDQAHSHDTSDHSYTNKPYWQKALVLSGGILFNLLFAYLSFCIFLMIGNNITKPTITILSVTANSAAQKAGLLAGDIIYDVDTHEQIEPSKQTAPNDNFNLLQKIQSSPNKEITLLVKRNEQEITVPIIPTAAKEDSKVVGKMGATFSPQIPVPAVPFPQVFEVAFVRTQTIIGMIIQSLVTLVKNRSMDGLGGPVAIFAQGTAAANYGFIYFLQFLGLLSLSLAIFNMLPIGALDGGQILFATIEFIIRRRIPEVIKLTINLASWVLLIGLTLFFTYRDIATLFGANLKAFWGKLMGLFR